MRSRSCSESKKSVFALNDVAPRERHQSTEIGEAWVHFPDAVAKTLTRRRYSAKAMQRKELKIFCECHSHHVAVAAHVVVAHLPVRLRIDEREAGTEWRV